MIEQHNFNSDLDFSVAAGDLESELDSLQMSLDPALLQSVEVQTEPAEGRQRRIFAKVQIPYSVEQVWQVLTDYESLADFIPNLAKSQRLEHPQDGIRIEQVGTQRLLRINFSARVVLDMEEKFPNEIRFNMVEGDFKAFSGCWQLEPWLPVSSPETPVPDQPGTSLTYRVLVWPKRTMPVTIIERRLCSDLRLNLLAISQRVDQLFGPSL
jgi:ribosome-associated toxin RatA of RatAB toxin-antitoxin module